MRSFMPRFKKIHLQNDQIPLICPNLHILNSKRRKVPPQNLHQIFEIKLPEHLAAKWNFSGEPRSIHDATYRCFLPSVSIGPTSSINSINLTYEFGFWKSPMT